MGFCVRHVLPAFIRSIVTCTTPSWIGGHLRVLEKSVFFNTLSEHELVVAVSGPVEQVLHQVLMILKNTLWNNQKQDTYVDIRHTYFQNCASTCCLYLGWGRKSKTLSLKSGVFHGLHPPQTFHWCWLRQTINSVYLPQVWLKWVAAAHLPICSSVMVSTKDQSGL